MRALLATILVGMVSTALAFDDDWGQMGGYGETYSNPYGAGLWQQGNSDNYYDSSGGLWQQKGNNLYDPNRGLWQQRGNHTYGPSGQRCSQYGQHVYCY